MEKINIYQLKHDSKQFKSIDLSNSKLLDITIDDNLHSNEFTTVISDQYTWVDTTNNKEICDFPFIAGSIPIFSERAFDLLHKQLTASNVEGFPFMVDKCKYFLLNFKTTNTTILNKKSSIIEYFVNGEIKNISDYVFNSDQLQNRPFFMIGDLKLFCFCTKEVVDIINVNSLTGLEFQECIVV